MPNTILGTWDTSINKTRQQQSKTRNRTKIKSLPSWSLPFSGRKMTVKSKEQIKLF